MSANARLDASRRVREPMGVRKEAPKLPEIKTIYFIDHNHTDIGYTDHQDVVFQKHMEFIDEAIEACEATADFHPDAAIPVDL